MDISYEWALGSYAYTNTELIEECSLLYSDHYGVWSNSVTKKGGKNIKLSVERIRNWLENENASIYIARDDNQLIGYAIAIRLKVKEYGVISWVTQLVVHYNYRHQDIAKNLLYSIWGFSDDFAWGVISANPYAIRALEKATRRRTDPKRIKRNIRKIISLGVENIPYIGKDVEYLVDTDTSKINTEFYVDHSNIGSMIKNVVSEDVPWLLGELDEGWEWLAFTFQDQDQISLTKTEIEKMLDASDKVVKQAYERMDLSENHKWAANTENEVSFIINELQLKKGDSIIDFGCGTGRHAFLLAENGINVTAIDYVSSRIEHAIKKQISKQDIQINFISADCRTVQIPKVKFAICLYDVIGSYANNENNLAILRNISNHLDINGLVLISVMNLEMTEAFAKHKFSLSEDASQLLSLKPSGTMESSGNIFNPDFYLIDTQTKLVYRKEQFRNGNSLPIELIVRDRRYTKNEIEQMCKEVGLEVIFSRYVNAKDWETNLESTSSAAKEILLKCKKVAELM